MSERGLVIKVVAMPKDTNPDGNIFGGWLLSQMDLAASLHVRKLTNSKIVTVAIDKLVFHKPVNVGDCIICYAEIEKIGTTSVTVKIDAIVERRKDHRQEQVTEGHFTFVAVGKDNKPVPILNQQ